MATMIAELNGTMIEVEARITTESPWRLVASFTPVTAEHRNLAEIERRIRAIVYGPENVRVSDRALTDGEWRATT